MKGSGRFRGKRRKKERIKITRIVREKKPFAGYLCMLGALFEGSPHPYIPLLSRNSKLLADLIGKTVHGRKYYHSRVSRKLPP